MLRQSSKDLNGSPWLLSRDHLRLRLPKQSGVFPSWFLHLKPFGSVYSYRIYFGRKVAPNMVPQGQSMNCVGTWALIREDSKEPP